MRDPAVPERPVALSLKQPWVYAVLHLGKNIENRSWRTRHRGRVILHASQTMDEAGLRFLQDAGFLVPAELPRGAYVGEVILTGCLPFAACASRWAFGPWCYTLEHPVAYPDPIPGKGQLGFYPVPEEVLRRVTVEDTACHERR